MISLILHGCFVCLLLFAVFYPLFWITIITKAGVRKRSLYASTALIMLLCFYYPNSQVEVRRWRKK